MDLEKIIKSTKQITGRVLSAGAILAMPYLAGCEDKDNDEYQPATTNSVPREGGSGGDQEDTNLEAPSDPVTADFAITYPVSGGTAPYRTTITGVGIKKEVASYDCTVQTDKKYTQVGTLKVNSDGTYSYSPLYLGGLGQYNDHTIEMKINYKDGTFEQASVTGVVRSN